MRLHRTADIVNLITSCNLKYYIKIEGQLDWAHFHAFAQTQFFDGKVEFTFFRYQTQFLMRM